MEKYPFGHTYLLHKITVVILEFFIVALACKLSLFLGWWNIGTPADGTISIFALSWIGMNALARFYDPEYIFDFNRYAQISWYALIPQFIFAWGYFMSLDITYIPYLFLIVFHLIAINFVLGFRWFIAKSYNNRRAWFGKHKVMIIGRDQTSDELFHFLMARKVSVLRYAKLELGEGEETPLVKQHLEEIKQICIDNQVDEIYSTLSFQNSFLMEKLADFADNHHIRFKLASSFDFLGKTDISVAFFDQIPIITLQNDPLASWVNRIVKRGFDIVFSGLVLLTIFPIIYAIIGILIKWEDRGPIFYMQDRAGRKNQKFLCYKFRTMYVRPEEQEYKQASKNDPRITRIGAFLRKTNLDEFPQFINVFLGHMSVVGPRPHPLKLNTIYAPLIDKYEYRHLITPGITGHAQVNGYRGETKDSQEMAKRIEYDNWYIKNWTLGLDVRIVFQTFIKTLVGDKNAY